MSDIMRPVPLQELVKRVLSEYKSGSIFGILKENFYKDSTKRKAKIFHQTVTTVLGPAAGPHTQLAQNIITSFLTGSRFIELKTVQIMDRLEIEKPCIDARDEGFNVEWSTEYTLYKARMEYYKAWIVCNFLDRIMFGQKRNVPNFVFNMSVGYNLEGIKNPRMQEFINTMINASSDNDFKHLINVFEKALSDSSLYEGTDLESAIKGYISAKSWKKISSSICKSVTISTMHGCPPKEIEAICSYMLTEKKIDTFVKLNPTLLGYDKVREILDKTGYNYVELKRESFEHDLQYEDAVGMLKRLKALAKKNKRCFGVKLTNTLGNVNDKRVLPGDERYMSGRSLFPISTALAAKISKLFDGKMPISYSGGVNIFNVEGLFKAGIKPITLATDMLHPGGYNKMKQMADVLSAYKRRDYKRKKIDVERISRIAEDAVNQPYVQKSFRGLTPISVNEKLPQFDCFISPCEAACPVSQNIVDYVGLASNGGSDILRSMGEIYFYNSLPNITCQICNHACESNCTRMDYEGEGVKIRDVKKFVVERAWEKYEEKIKANKITENGVKVAVIGAGPAGLATAIQLREYGYNVTVFERENEPGGVVRYVIPDFRISRDAIKRDYMHAVDLGVKFNFGVQSDSVTISTLKIQGFERIFYCVGSEKERTINVDVQSNRMTTALEFLKRFKVKQGSLDVGANIVIIGGGNTAMDTARAALKTQSALKATILYRKLENDMPAEREEIELARKDGVNFIFLAAPKSHENGKLSYYKMKIEGRDEKGRTVTNPTEEVETIDCDYVITAVGETQDIKALEDLGLPINEAGKLDVNPQTFATTIEGVYAVGDVATGPKTVISCVASATSAVYDLLSKDAEKEAIKLPESIKKGECDCGCGDKECNHDNCDCDKDAESFDSYVKNLRLEHGKVCTKLPEFGSDDFATKVHNTCLDCQSFCGKCVDVCPNRANMVIDIGDALADELDAENKLQIVHLDAYCNECGNCASFCPYSKGRPYMDKFTVFSRKDDILSSTNDGFYVEGRNILIRDNAKAYNTTIDSQGNVKDEQVGQMARAVIKTIYTKYNYLLGAVEE